MRNFLFQLMIRMIFLMTAVPVHQYAKAYMTTKLGDPSARNAGMLTLNPAVHLDLLGSLSILLIGFGWGKTLPTNPFYYRDKKKGMAAVAFAGPAANLILAFLLMVIKSAFIALAGHFNFISFQSLVVVVSLIEYMVQLNIWYAIFNLIPLPPMGGFSLLRLVISDEVAYELMRYQQYIMIGLLVGIYTGILTTPIQIVANIIYRVFSFVVGLVPFL